MKARICPECEHHNPLYAWKCAACGNYIGWEFSAILNVFQILTGFMLASLLLIMAANSPEKMNGYLLLFLLLMTIIPFLYRLYVEE